MLSLFPRLWRELKRRKVFRVAAVYAGTAFVVWQTAAIAFPALGLPDWTLTLVVMLALLGFPVALVLAWAFEVTPDGVRRTEAGAPPPAGAGDRGPDAGAAASSASGRLAAGVGIGIVIAAVGLGAHAYLSSDGDGRPAEGERSIAVLPFSDLSREGDQAYFSDGITEDILTRLARISGLRVISRTSVMRYRDTEKDIPGIAAELGVRYVLEGSVRKVGDELRITGQLIDARSDEHIWAESYDRDLTNVFEIQSEIATEIARALEVRLTEAEREQLGRGGTESPLAYDLYLQGRDVLGRIAPSYEAYLRNVETARTLFHRALREDSTFATARAALSFTFSTGGLQLDDDLRYDSALAHARQALALDPGLPEGHVALGEAHFIKDYAEAAYDHFLGALRLSPSHAGALRGLATAYNETGRYAEELATLKRVIAVEPNVFPHHRELARALLRLGFFGRSEAEYRRAYRILFRRDAGATATDSVRLRCDLASVDRRRGDTAAVRRHVRAMLAARERSTRAGECAAWHLLWLGDYAEAGSRLRQALDEGEHPPEARTSIRLGLALVHLESGRPDRARSLLEAAEEEIRSVRAQSPELEDPIEALAAVHALRGERDEAVSLLRESYRRHGPTYFDLRTDPYFRRLAGHPGYDALIEEMRNDLERMRQRAEREGLVD